MSSRPARFHKPVVSLVLVQALLAGCSGDGSTGPNPPDQVDPAATGEIVVSLLSARLGLNLSLTIAGSGTWSPQPNEAVQVDHLRPGKYRVSLKLGGVPAGETCQVRDGEERIALVLAGETTEVRYVIDCVALRDRPR